MKNIVTNKNILSGKPFFKGTRIDIEFILNQFLLGWSIHEICERFPELSENKIKNMFKELISYIPKKNIWG